MAILALAIAAAAAGPAGAPSLEGLWANPAASVIVEITPCGEAICGTVRQASEKAKADARRGGTDPLVGVELLSGFALTGAGRWKGRLFVPDINKRTAAELRPAGPDRLRIVGCAVGRLICKSQLWTRVDAGDGAGNRTKDGD